MRYADSFAKFGGTSETSDIADAYRHVSKGLACVSDS